MNGSADDPHRYDDIIGLPHHVSSSRPPMSREMRAAQFAPFAALTGYDAAVKETARLTDRRIELGDDEKQLLSGKLQLLQDSLHARPETTITYFRPDERKEGGAYIAATGIVKKINVFERRIIMASGQVIPIDDVIAIDGALFKDMDARIG